MNRQKPKTPQRNEVPIADYKKFFLLLSSQNDGEVVAAARAIGRKLKAEGKDWHWLADQLGAGLPKPSRPAPRPASKPQRPAYQDMSFGDFVMEDITTSFEKAMKRAAQRGWKPSDMDWRKTYRKK